MAFMDVQTASSGSGLVGTLWALVLGAAALYLGRELLQQVIQPSVRPALCYCSLSCTLVGPVIQSCALTEPCSSIKQ